MGCQFQDINRTKTYILKCKSERKIISCICYPCPSDTIKHSLETFQTANLESSFNVLMIQQISSCRESTIQNFCDCVPFFILFISVDCLSDTFLEFCNSPSNTRKRNGIKLTIETPERRHSCCSGVSIVNFEPISHLFPVFLLLTLKLTSKC